MNTADYIKDLLELYLTMRLTLRAMQRGMSVEQELEAVELAIDGQEEASMRLKRLLRHALDEDAGEAPKPLQFSFDDQADLILHY